MIPWLWKTRWKTRLSTMRRASPPGPDVWKPAANSLAGPLRDLAPEIMARLKPEGRLVLSGLLDIQADAVEAAYAPLGPARRLVSGDWVALIWGLNSHGAA